VGQRTVDIPAFTEMVGGGYFFLPGLTALRFLASQGEGDLPDPE
jgi:hypothetical protein